MYTVKEIIPYEFTRDIIFQDSSGKEIKVFDDTDLLGDNDFSFLKPGKKYDCSIGILGNINNDGEIFQIGKKKRIGAVSFIELIDSNNNKFYLEPDNQKLDTTELYVKLEVERYDLLQVNKVINSRFK
ncbi:hypothetical protein K7E08_05580 [Ligilactobacillus salivarius]|uniref:hypothetical protein n=1 Tax=Ligilactobacillus salivarius TaxID=1624 RepID=UPI001CBE4861|nr:hypothetical protein [Ligilactobacillus salivarius]MBZ4025914.1 hypothetical protein [Ligilactobacillus salivarius]MBZ4030413.1 hypothetical protein [Ligilactobacillus salivarius]